MPAIVTDYPVATTAQFTPGQGLAFPPDGSGLFFDAGYPLIFPPDAPADPASLFPSYVPQPEQAIFQAVADACSSRTPFPATGEGLALPAQFSIPPMVGLYAGHYPGDQIAFANGDLVTVPEIPVTRGWPAYPGAVPAIGVTETNASDDMSDEAVQAGFAGDVFARDPYGNVLATAAYYAQPLVFTIVVELIHTNRDERDRLHDQLRLVLYPLRSILPETSSQIREVSVDSEKQDLPVEEQPIVMYVSVYTVTVRAEALIATEVVPGGVIDQITTTVTEYPTSTIDPTPLNPDFT